MPPRPAPPRRGPSRPEENRRRAAILRLLLGATLLPALLPTIARAQERLTLDEAIAIARANNYAIRRSTNDVRIAENNNTPGNAGFLPKLDLTAGYNGALSNVNQKLTSGDIVTRSNAASNTVTSGLALTWTVFDGFRMNAQRERLAALRTLAGTARNEAEEGASADVIRAYYDIVRQQRVLGVIGEAVALSNARVENVELKYKVGENSKRELLQAKVDLNADSSSMLWQRAVVSDAKIALNQLLARDGTADFTVADSIDIDAGLDYETLRKEAIAANSLLRTARVAQSLARADLRTAGASRYPRVGVSLGYNLLQNDAQTGQITSNRNLGLTYGLTASMNLYDGLNTDRETENAKIAIENSDITYAEAQAQMEADLLKAYGNYRNRLDVVALEQANLGLARENFDLAQERYKVGVLIPLELREAQNALVAAESRLVSARYDAKIAETELLGLSGRLAR